MENNLSGGKNDIKGSKNTKFILKIITNIEKYTLDSIKDAKSL